MTQAFNLSQLANNVNTSGQLNAAAGLYNQTLVANGGTGVATVTAGGLLIGAGTSAMTTLTGGATGHVVTWSGTAWGSAAAGGSAAPTVTVYTSPGTWTKSPTVKGIKVTIVGGGGNAASYSPANSDSAGGGGGGAAIKNYSAPALPGPQPFTVGPAGSGASSFGVAPAIVITATGGVIGGGAPSPAPAIGGAGGAGSNGDLNVSGGRAQNYTPIQSNGNGGSSILGFGGVSPNTSGVKGTDGTGYGGGGGGGRFSSTPTVPGALGSAGVVIIEEFY